MELNDHRMPCPTTTYELDTSDSILFLFYILYMFLFFLKKSNTEVDEPETRNILKNPNHVTDLLAVRDDRRRREKNM
jgi:hypothetical protein